MTVDSLIQLGVLLLMGAAALGSVSWKIISYINEVDKRRSDNVKELHLKIDIVANSLDTKYNNLRTEVAGRHDTLRDEVSALKDNMVRRDDFRVHSERLERGQETLAHAFDSLRERVETGFLEIARATSAKEKNQ